MDAKIQSASVMRAQGLSRTDHFGQHVVRPGQMSSAKVVPTMTKFGCGSNRLFNRVVFVQRGSYHALVEEG